MKYLILFLLMPLMSFSQNKGASPIAASQDPSANKNTYAVVVGISDYQDKDIPDLRYADKDAEAFANFLRSEAGGKLDGDHLKVLLNSQATMAQFAIALDWLWEVAKENDKVIIYFSGHGDVEKKSLTQPGFLLCWDAPAQVYMSGGAFALPMLQEVISTLSVLNKAKVIVITDACRSGKLSGSAINGSQLTNANLAKQYANEIKILSCQPNEYSIEGEQWGGGRGAFSYHLVNALYGLADGNNDLLVTLQEAGRYLEDHVTAEVAPVSQVPMVLGNRNERLTSVDARLLADLRSGGSSHMTILSPIESRGMEEDVLAAVDTTTREVYRLFMQALKDKVFLDPAGACADAYYLRLIAEPRMQRLHSTMTRNYAAALQDDAQQATNNIMQMEKTEYRLYRLERIKKYAPYPRHLERAAELLGKDHYQYATLQARKCYFEGWVLQLESSLNRDTVLAHKLISKYKEAIHWAPAFSPPYLQISQVYRKLDFNIDSCDFYASKVLEVSPNWIFAINNIAHYNWYQSQYGAYSLIRVELARNLFMRSLIVDSSRAETWAHLAAFYYYRLNRLDSAQYCLWKSLSLDSTYSKSYFYLGVLEFNGRNNQANSEKYFLKSSLEEKPSAEVFLYLGAIYRNRGDVQLAKFYYEKGIAIEPFQVSINLYLTDIYLGEKEPQKAFQLVQNMLGYDSLSPVILPELLRIYTKHSYFNEAEKICKEAILRDPFNLFHLGDYYVGRKMYQEAEEVYLKWVSLDTTQAKVFGKLANFYKSINNDLKAEAAYLKCLSLDSLNAVNYNSLGWFYFGKKDDQKAEYAFLKSIALDSNYFLAWINLGLLYNRAKRYDEGEKMFLKAISIDSMRVNSWLNLGVAYEGLGQFEKMEWASRRAISLQDNNFKAWLNLALALYNLRQFEKAEGTLKKAISLDKLDVDIWKSLGWKFSRMNLLDEAEIAYSRAILFDSLNAYNYNNLGWVYIQLNQLKEGEINLLKAIDLDSSFVNAHTLLALIYLNTNRKEKSKQFFERALYFNADFLPVLFGMTYLQIGDGKYREAFVFLDMAVQKGTAMIQSQDNFKFSSFNAVCLLYSLQGLTYEMLQNDEQLSPLRSLPEWTALMKKYFPDKVKN